MEWAAIIVSALLGGIAGAFIGLQAGQGIAYLWGVLLIDRVLPYEAKNFSMGKHCANNGRMFGLLTGLLAGVVGSFITSIGMLLIAVCICSVIGVLAARSFIISAGGQSVFGLEIGAVGGAVGGGSVGYLARKLVGYALTFL